APPPAEPYVEGSATCAYAKSLIPRRKEGSVLGGGQRLRARLGGGARRVALRLGGAAQEAALLRGRQADQLRGRLAQRQMGLRQTLKLAGEALQRVVDRRLHEPSVTGAAAPGN